MSQLNQLMATLAVGFALSIGLMWTAEKDSLRGRPHHHTDVSQIEKSVTTVAAKVQQARY